MASLLSVLADIATLISLCIAVIATVISPELQDIFKKYVLNSWYLYSRLAQIRTGYTLHFIEETVGQKHTTKIEKKYNTNEKLTDWNQYIFSHRKFMLELITDKAERVVAYAVISRHRKFNPEVNWYEAGKYLDEDAGQKERKIRVNRTCFSELDTYRSSNVKYSHRGNSGCYKETHSLLGDTTNGFAGGVLLNLNFAGKSITEKAPLHSNLFNEEGQKEEIRKLPFNGFWVVDQNAIMDSDAERSVESEIGTGNYYLNEII
jgi:hypothetical protein